MKRTKPAPPVPTGKRKSKDGSVKTTYDGRILGKSLSDFMPESLKNIVPPPKDIVASRQQQRKMHSPDRIARSLLPPEETEAATEDSIKTDSGSVFRIRGLTQTRFNALIAGLRMGLTRSAACELAGVGKTTLTKWERKAESGLYPYTVIAQAMRIAEVELEQELLGKLIEVASKEKEYVETTVQETFDEDGNKIGKTRKTTMQKRVLPQWKAGAWLLERMSDRYKLVQPDKQEDIGDTGETDLLMMDGTTLGKAEKADTAKEDEASE